MRGVASHDVVVTDLDGTLWHHGVLHPRTADALADLRRQDVPVVAATSRRRSSAFRAIAAFDLSLDVIAHDGSLGCFAGGTVFHACPFSEAAVRDVVAVLGESGYEPVFETDGEDAEALVGAGPSFLPERLAKLRTLRCDLSEPLPRPAFSAVVAVEPAAAVRLIAELVATGSGLGWAEPHASSGRALIRMRPAGCSKWEAVLRYCEATGRDADRVLAIGNDDNDVELLQNAALSLVMAGSSSAALLAADRVVGPVEDGNWAELLTYV